MATCEQKTPLTSLDLPDEFEDLTGLLQTDLKVIVAMLTQRAERAPAADPPREPAAPAHPLEQPDAGVNEAVEPLSADRR